MDWDPEPDPPPPEKWEIKRENYKRVKELKIVFRDEWGAKEPLEQPYLKMPVRNILLTYTNTPPCWDDEECAQAVRDIQADQMAKGAVDIHWNFIVGGNGKVYEGRGWFVKPQKSPPFEGLRRSYDIAYIATDHDPKQVTEKMKFQKGQLIRFSIEQLMVKDPHNFIEDKINLDEIRRKRKEEEKEKEKKRKLQKKAKKEAKAKAKLEKEKKKKKKKEVECESSKKESPN